MSDTQDTRTFQDALAEAARDAWFHMAGGEGHSPDEPDSGDRQIAWRILQAPEMQAIRETLFDLTHPTKWTTADGPRALHVKNLRAYDLPEHVIDWVLAHE